jgi:hypothetical protein
MISTFIFEIHRIRGIIDTANMVLAASLIPQYMVPYYAGVSVTPRTLCPQYINAAQQKI